MPNAVAGSARLRTFAFLWKTGFVWPPYPDCFRSYRRLPCTTSRRQRLRLALRQLAYLGEDGRLSGLVLRDLSMPLERQLLNVRQTVRRGRQTLCGVCFLHCLPLHRPCVSATLAWSPLPDDATDLQYVRLDFGTLTILDRVQDEVDSRK